MTGGMTATRLHNGSLTVTVSDLGAEMQSLAGPDGAARLWHGDPAFWPGRAPILFPIVGRAPGDLLAVNGQVAPMAQHGFARRSRFALTEAGDEFCRHTLTDSPATHAAYPCAFRLTITHRLQGATLRVEAEVTNPGTDAQMGPLPFGFGFHPAFVWPLPGADGAAHVVTLDNGAEPALARLRDGLLTGATTASPFRSGRLELHPGLFAEGALVFPAGAGPGLRYGVPGGPGLRFAFENLPNLALWTKPGAPFLCIEPWHGMAAHEGASPDIAERPGTLTLAPGATCRFAMSVTPEQEATGQRVDALP